MPQLEDIHRILLDQNRDLGYIKAKVESLEEQAKKANGRTSKLEDVVDINGSTGSVQINGNGGSVIIKGQ